MSYLDDLKKKASGVVNNVNNAVKQGTQAVQNTVNTAQNVYNTAKNTVSNVIGAGNAAANAANDYLSGGNKPQSAQTVQPETNWAEEYDKVMSGGATNSPPTSTTTPTTQAPSTGVTTTNPDGSVTVTQPNGQQVNTSQAASSVLGSGAGQWQTELDGIMNQIMNREKFSFDMNGDAMYQQYADMYQNQANLGMQNAMAQAAALTGGYGSSYGQMVGQQAYAQQMQGLNDVALDLYDRAYNQYQDEGNQLAQQYAMIADREQQAYNRDYQGGRDAVADEQWDQSFEYQKYLDELNQKNYENEFDYTKERNEVSDKQWQDSFDYQKSQDDQAQENYENEFAYQQSQDKQAQENYENEFAYQQSQDKQAQENYENEFAYQQSQDKQAQSNYEKEFAYQQGRDTINDKRYDEEWKASEEQRGLDNKYRDEALKEDQRQFDESMDWQAEEFDKMYGEDGYYTKQNAQDQANWETQWEASEEQRALENSRYDTEWKASEEQRALENKRYDDAVEAEKEASNPNTTYEGEGALNGQSVPKQLAGVQGLTTTNTNLFDDNGHFKTAAVVSGTTAEGNLNNGTPEAGVGTMTYNIGGKEVTLKTGTSPYTNTVNPDAKNGVMENGYQPDNVGGVKLEEGDTEALVNGQWVPTYTTPKDGKSWYYDAANNKYEEIPADDEEKPEEKPKTNESGEYKIGASGGGGSKKPVYIAHD